MFGIEVFVLYRLNSKISYIWTLFTVQFIRDSGLFRVQFIQDSGLFRVQFIQDSGLFRVQFIQDSGLFRVQFRQDSGLFRVQFRQVSLYHKISITLALNKLFLLIIVPIVHAWIKISVDISVCFEILWWKLLVVSEIRQSRHPLLFLTYNDACLILIINEPESCLNKHQI